MCVWYLGLKICHPKNSVNINLCKLNHLSHYGNSIIFKYPCEVVGVCLSIKTISFNKISKYYHYIFGLFIYLFNVLNNTNTAYLHIYSLKNYGKELLHLTAGPNHLSKQSSLKLQLLGQDPLVYNQSQPSQ